MPLLPTGDLVRLRLLVRPLVVRRHLSGNPAPKLHIGCGPRPAAGWLNADKYSALADIYLDAHRRLPFPADSFDVVYSEHMIEHLRIERVEGFLREVHRILRPGGLFRVTCPDLELFAKRYAAGDGEFFAPIIAEYAQRSGRRRAKNWLIRSHGGAFMTRAVHSFFRHHWMYDFATLGSCLEEVGFTPVLKQSFRQGLNGEAAALDNPRRAFETLYIDAVKALPPATKQGSGSR